MKGVMGFLAKAGLVTVVDDIPETTDYQPVVEPVTLPELTVRVAPVEDQIALSFPEVYAAAGVPPSDYPAEQLLRLLEGLKAMDPATQRTVVAAMDAADDAWTIEDPIRDAEYKVQALAAHANALHAGVESANAETTKLITAVKQREEATVADIRAQIYGLEELMSREIARSVQEQTDLTVALTAKREAANRLVEQGLVTSAAFKLLVNQFRQGALQLAAEQPASQASTGT